MKKIVLSSILASSLLLGSDYKYEIAPMIGYIDTGSKMDLKNHKTVGLGLYKNMDEDCKLDQLELALLHSDDADYKNTTLGTDTNIIMANAIKEYQISDTFGLYALAGLGYHQIKDEHFGDDSEGFFDYGVGAKIKLAERLALKLDARHMLRFDGSTNTLYTLGLAIPFGEKTPKTSPVKAQPQQDIKPKPTTQTPKDSDNDGVIDTNDKCPNSAPGAKVDPDGCDIIIKPVDLGIVFDTDSAKIKSTDLEKFEKFVAYAKKVPNQGILIEAHTDNIGSAKYNMGLSHRRALSAKKQLIKMGIDKDRISTKGYGETKPKVANTSRENRQINRRVEAKIQK